MATNAETLIKAGFVRDPNVRDEWYAARPGIMEPALGFHLLASETQVSLAVQPYGKFNWADMVDVYRFADAVDVLSFLSKHGVVSEPGMPAYSFKLANSWD